MNEVISVVNLNLVSVATVNGIPQNGTVFTEPVPTWRSTGYAGMRLTTSAGSISVNQQCAFDIDGPWFNPVDESNIAMGVVVTSMSAATRYVQFDPVLSKFTRFRIVESNVGSSTWSAQFFYQERT